MTAVRVHPEVVGAARDGRAIVALETAVLTHGLPREPRAAPGCVEEFGCEWSESHGANIATIEAMCAVVRREGAVPAVVGMKRGELVVGLDDAEIGALGSDASAVKVAARDLAVAHAGGTTVAGTLKAIALANRELPRPIRVFATGGIGGVHRQWTERPDVSADLLALATTPACVVSAGAKSILDLGATLEALDALGVPVLGLGTKWFPRFFCEGSAELAVQREVADVRAAAAICQRHWNDFASTTGVLLANPPPSRWALPVEVVERALASALDEARRRSVRAAELTPMLLSRIADATSGQTVDSNIAVLLNNTRAGAALANTLC